jgi:hypothetical protein
MLISLTLIDQLGNAWNIWGYLETLPNIVLPCQAMSQNEQGVWILS